MDSYFKKKLWVDHPRSGAIFAIGIELLMTLLFYWGMLFCLFAFSSIEFKRNTFITMGLAGAVMSFFFAYAQMVLFTSYCAFIRQLVPRIYHPLQWIWAVLILKIAPLALLSVFLPLAIRQRKWGLALIVLLAAVGFLLPFFSLAYLSWGFVLLALYGALMMYIILKQNGEAKVTKEAFFPGAVVLLLVAILVLSVGVLKTINAYGAYNIAQEFRIPPLSRSDFLTAYYRGNIPGDAGFESLAKRAQTLSAFFREYEQTGRYPQTPKERANFAKFCSDNAETLQILDTYAARTRYETLEYDIILFTRPRALSMAQNAGFNYYLHMMYLSASDGNRPAFELAELKAINLLTNAALLPKRNESLLYLARVQRLAELYYLIASDGFFSTKELMQKENFIRNIAQTIPSRLLLALSCDYQGVEWCCNYIYVEAPQVAMQAFLRTERDMPLNFYSIQFWGELDKFYLLRQFKYAIREAVLWKSAPDFQSPPPPPPSPKYAIVKRLVAPHQDNQKLFAARQHMLLECAKKLMEIRLSQLDNK